MDVPVAKIVSVQLGSECNDCCKQENRNMQRIVGE